MRIDSEASNTDRFQTLYIPQSYLDTPLVHDHRDYDGRSGASALAWQRISEPITCRGDGVRTRERASGVPETQMEARGMGTTGNGETTVAPVKGYILAPGESLENPYFPATRGLAWAASTGGLALVMDGVLEPGDAGPYRHYHTNLTELFYVLEGEVLLQIGDQVTCVQPGSFAFCPIGCVHAFRAAGEEKARLLMIGIGPGVGEEFLRELAMLPPDASQETRRQIAEKGGYVVVGPPLEAK